MLRLRDGNGGPLWHRQWYDQCPNPTVIDMFEGETGLKLLTIKVRCPKCGRTWGVRIDDYNTPADIPDRKFSCSQCKK